MHGCAQHAATKRDEAHAYAFLGEAVTPLEQYDGGTLFARVRLPGLVVAPNPGTAQKRALAHFNTELRETKLAFFQHTVQMIEIEHEDVREVCAGQLLYVYHMQTSRDDPTTHRTQKQLFGLDDAVRTWIDQFDDVREQQDFTWGYLLAHTGSAAAMQLTAFAEVKYPTDEGWDKPELALHTVTARELGILCK
jgi:hypothetical protein